MAPAPFSPRKPKLSWERHPATFRSHLAGSRSQPRGKERALRGPGESQFIPDDQSRGASLPQVTGFLLAAGHIEDLPAERKGLAGGRMWGW